MRLIELYAEEFGCLVDRRFSFGEGLHVIEGPNESGKSTLMALLRFLFYGFGRRGAEQAEERARRLSRKGHRAAGHVIFLWQGKEVVLCRDLVVHTSGGREAPTEHMQVYLRQTGAPIELGAMSAGEYFLGLPLALYHSSACVRQSEIDSISGGQTGDAVSEFLFLGVGGARLERAARSLDEARRALQHNRGTGGKIPALESEREACAAAYAKAAEGATRIYEIGEEKRICEKSLAAATRDLTALHESQRVMHLSQALGRYDEWHAARAREKEAELAWQGAVQRAEADFPSEQALQDASCAQSAYGAAAARCAACLLEVTRAERELARHALTAPRRAVQELGGADAVKGRVQAGQARARAYGLAALACMAAVLFFALGAAFLPAVRVALGGGGAVMLLLSLVLLLLRGHADKRCVALLSRLGLSDVRLLRTLLIDCEQALAVRQVCEAQLACATENSREAEVLCQQARSQLQNAFDAAGIAFAEGEDTQALLADMQARRREAAMRCEAEKLKYEKAKSARMALENGLDLTAEPTLRAAHAALPDANMPQQGTASYAQLTERISALQEQLRALEREEADHLAGGPTPVAAKEALLRVEGALAAARQRLAAVKMAAEALQAADATLREGVLPTLASRASDILRRLTGGAYGRLHVSGDLVAFLETDEGLFPLSHSSAGARDIAYFALRAALLEMITEEPLPLLLDEVCARLDDARATHLLDFLSAYCGSGAQCLLFTCHTREALLLEGRPYRHICLA
ncbi:MAG: hypothetical protein E7639_04765 [Ruminococcaceae bacterium]|nr:hypothetical protein [Oscillospiraceae bacterium]